jgi:hypothetical protein
VLDDAASSGAATFRVVIDSADAHNWRSSPRAKSLAGGPSPARSLPGFGAGPCEHVDGKHFVRIVALRGGSAPRRIAGSSTPTASGRTSLEAL